MRKFVAAVLLLIGLVLVGLAYSYYSEYEMGSHVAQFYRTHPEEIPTGGSREQQIAEEQAGADRDLSMAMLSGAGALLLCLGGAALFMLGGRKDTFSVSPSGGLDEDPVRHSEEMNLWASVALARPVEVHYRRRYGLMFAFIMFFFI